MDANEALSKEASLMPSVYANKIHLAVIEGGYVRLTFAEEVPGIGIIAGRCSVVLSPENAVAMKGLIDRFITQVELLNRRN